MKVKVWKLLGLISVMIFAFSATSMVHATATLGTSSTIPNLSGNMAYDSGKGELFVVDGSGLVSVVSDSSNSVVATISIPDAVGYVNGIVYDSGKGEIFVATGYALAAGSGPTVWVISDTTNTIVANITSSHWWSPWGLAYDSAMGEIFLTDAGKQPNVFGAVYIISDTTNAITGSISVGMWPKEIVYDSGMNKVFVANTGSASVSVILDGTNTVVSTVDVGVVPSGMAYDSSKGEIFVANSANNTVSVISDSTNTVAATITGLSGYQSLGIEGVVYNPAKGEIFAGNVVISDSTNTVVAQLPYNIGAAVYNSGKGEVVSATATSGLDIFSDSSSATTSPTPTHTSASAAPSSTVPEFSSVALVSVGAAIIALTVTAVALKARTRKPLRK